MTVSCTSELNAIIVPCCLEKSSPHAQWSAGVGDGKVRSDITAIAVISQLRPGGDFQVTFSLITLDLSTSSLGFFS